MTKPYDDLIATLLGDAPASPALRRWLATPEGRRERAAYRRVLGDLAVLWGRPRDVRRHGPAYWAALRTPIGRVLVATTDAGIVRVRFRTSDASFTRDLRRLHAEPVRSPARTAAAVAQLRAYFAGRRRAVDLPVDLSRVTPFQRRVLLAARGVPAGRVVSYGELARRIGRPRASRAVGRALGANPVPIVIPCHRVVASGGGLGGYTGGLDVKRRLLGLEGALHAATA
jgi:methylated-DNA-[protein]-cysteine S-methyltransferase